MHRGFTLVECMIAGAILALVVTTFMKALAVINRVEFENAQYLEADAIVWDAIAETFNMEFKDIPKDERVMMTSVRGFPAELHVSFDGSVISSWIKWNEGRQVLSNEVMRSTYARGEGSTR